MDKTTTDILARLGETDEETAVLIGNLIQRRERERNARLADLGRQAKDLVRAYRTIARDRLLEEIACFKEVLALHRKLTEDHDPPGN